MKKNKQEITIRSSTAEYLTYIASVGDDEKTIEVRYQDENIWLTQKMMAELYGVKVSTINEHIKKIFADNELVEDSTIRNFRIVQNEGGRKTNRDTKHYNLQMIIAVGFKVNNERAVQFRKWANSIVKDYTIQDYVFTDGTAENSVERRFAEDLDKADEVCVYAKLPRSFQIPTPVGNYAPDWAIAFNDGYGIKHIYFVAETKGTMESLELRPIEQARIKCARKLFNELSTSKVRYHDVTSYEDLLNVMKSIN